MTKSIVLRLTATAGVALVMSSAAYAVDQCADANGQNQLVTNTCTVDGNGPNIPCSGNDFNNVIIGSPGVDVIKAFGGNDIVVGLDGDDIICLDAGNDFADGGTGANVIRAGSGNDLVNTATIGAFPGRTFGGTGSDTLIATFGGLISFGGAGNDGLFGDALDDVLQGQGGVDFLSGADGADTLDGGDPGPTGTGFGDVCVGGDGGDTLLNCEVAVQ